MALFLLHLIQTLFTITHCQTTTELTFTVHSDEIINRIPEMYFGFTLDWWKPIDGSNGIKWGDASILWLNLSNPILINLTKALTPAILRLGGSLEDSIVYNISGECLKSSSEQYGCSQCGGNYGCLNESRWQQILRFMDTTQLSLVFGLNACFGRDNRSTRMNYTNIEQLLNYTIKQYKSDFIQTPIYGFELGNEIQWSIDGDIYAKDFAHIQSLLNTTWTDAKMSSNIPFMIGPDGEQGDEGWQWNSEILETLNEISNGDVPSIQRALTYHHYPKCGSPNGNVSVFNLGCLSSIPYYAQNYTSELANAYGVDVWMGEGSEYSGGGVLNLTNVFVSSFYYVYQLCELATHGVKGAVRSDLMGGYYELINHTTSIPTPDYWMLYLWRQHIGDLMYNSSLSLKNEQIGDAFVGEGMEWNYANDVILEVVSERYNASEETYVRGYSFAYRGDLNDYFIVLINFHLWDNAKIDIVIENEENRKYFYEYDEYHIVGVGADGLKTKEIEINGVKMEYVNGQFPSYKPIAGTGIVNVDPKTIVLVHVRQTDESVMD